MKKIFLGFTFLVFTLNCAQAQTWQWGRRGGGAAGLNNQPEKIVDMATDANGNVYMLAQLDGASNVTIGTSGADSSLTNQLQGGNDVALISYNCSGLLRWAKVFGSSLDDYAGGLTLDTLGNIYISMTTDKNFYVDIDSFTVNSRRKTIGLIQYDTSGKFKWFRQPNPDSVTVTKNLTQFGAGSIYTMSNGDTYMYCGLGTGLLANSANIVVNTFGYYILKFNVNGLATELIKLDITILQNTGFNISKFSITKSKKILFTGIPDGYNGTYPTVGGQQIKRKVFLCCFSPTGSVLWKVENTDTTIGGISGRPLLDESKGLIYVCGAAGSNGTTDHDTIQNFVIKNNYSFVFKRALPFIMSVDTLGIVKTVKNGYGYLNVYNVLNDLTFRKDGRLFAAGNGGGVVWDGFVFDNSTFTGEHTFMPSFNAATGAVMSMDSLMGGSATYGEILAADKDSNIYLGGQFSADIVIAGQTLQSAGGVSDFYVAKYGYANCSGLVPLKFLKFEVRSANEPTPNPSLEGNVLLQWTTANEVNVSHFNIQRSINGRDFTTIAKVVANNKSFNEYSFMDNGQQSMVDRRLYYRIESVDKDGYKDYSEVRQIAMGNGQLGISVYPNPAKDFITIDCKGAKEFKIIDYLGRVVTHKKIINYQLSIINIQDFAKGMYIVQIATDKGEVLNKKLLVE